ncbi:MAG: DUF4352 domain-containing protein [Ruminococcus sp.]|nr:DUF4352 domain-containing protein [Ruminococcus sp.]
MKFKKFSLLACSIAVIAAFSGCADKESVKPASGDNAPVVTTRVTKTGSVGNMIEMDGVEVTINGVYSSEYQGYVGDIPTRVVFLDVTVTNNTDDEIDTNMLTSFEFEADGEYFDSATLYAISCAKKQYGDDVNMFTETIKPGNSQTGCISAELPENFTSIQLSFLPFGGADKNYDLSKAITYSFTKDDLTEIKRPTLSED